jgi:uncharacterized protein
MKKKQLFLCLPAAAFLFLAAPVFAQNRVFDNAGLLNAGEKSEMEGLLAQIASNFNFNLVIVTEKDIGGAEPMNYADDFFDYNGFIDKDGCLFLQVTGTRDWWFSTSGKGEKILPRSSSAFKKLERDVVKFLKEDNPAQAYRVFIKNWEEFLVLEAEGKSYNFLRAYSIQLFIGAWIVSLLIALFAVYLMKLKMNNVHPKTEADSFIVPGSLVFTKQNDTFLFCTVTKTERQSESSSSSGSHTSSSGRSHGGGGGKY